MTDKTNDVKILVKNVYAPAESQQFVVVDSLQVRTLKEMIAAALPGNPQPKHQKLIFGGKICDDDTTLAKVLAGQNKEASADAASTDEAAPFVFHLMVSSGVPRSRPTTPVARSQTPTAAPTPVPVTPTAEPSPAPATVGGATPTPMQPASAGYPFMGFFGAAPASGVTPTATSPGVSHHGNHHQHLYTQALLMQQQAMVLAQIQYLQQLQAHHAAHAGSGPTATPPQAQGMFPPYGHFGHQFHHAYGMPHHPQVFGLAAAHVPGFAGAGAHGVQVPGAAVDPATAAAVEPRPRGPIAQAFAEILPLFDIRLAMKMAFMLFIIGQDTPTDRLIVLALMSFGAYLHITGILGKVYELLKRSRGVEGENAEANGQADANNANPNGAPNPQARLGSITPYLRISSDRGFLRDIRYFITGLLLSLVPAWHPQPLNANPAAPARQEPPVADAAPELPLQGI